MFTPRFIFTATSSKETQGCRIPMGVAFQNSFGLSCVDTYIF